ncbi:AraC family transcriptional regulator [Lasiodiplodia theobromae]|uniref:Uncharacterized protein n=1 Tax=Lasiodiplodia theobromae TaxID=45133 RepID=A0A5N5DEE4_9PEZI|nr:AraC family transcriptional regulator [Lasiodiplodia theobromae]KAB2576226.1 hypothetical protein DBV05_g5056 [Lasiodiplodia theobromae]KAF4533986.1 AraC family transcriptional regulator [Lasiodiplodia theobromae]
MEVLPRTLSRSEPRYQHRPNAKMPPAEPRLLGIPRELRDQILREYIDLHCAYYPLRHSYPHEVTMSKAHMLSLFVPDGSSGWTSPAMNILLVNKQIKDEFLDALWAHTQIIAVDYYPIIEDNDALVHWIKELDGHLKKRYGIPSYQCNHIQNLELQLDMVVSLRDNLSITVCRDVCLAYIRILLMTFPAARNLSIALFLNKASYMSGNVIKRIHLPHLGELRDKFRDSFLALDLYSLPALDRYFTSPCPSLATVNSFIKTILSRDTLPALTLYKQVDTLDWQAGKVKTVAQVARDPLFWSTMTHSHKACRRLGLDYHVLRSSYNMKKGNAADFRLPEYEASLYCRRLQDLERAYAAWEHRSISSETATRKRETTEDEAEEALESAASPSTN